MKYGEMDSQLKDAVVFGFMTRLGCNEKAARSYLDDHPEFTTDTFQDMQVGDEKWNGIMREMLWGDLSDDKIVALCS